MGQLPLLRPALRAATAIALDMADGAGEPERGSLVPPVERQTCIGHQLVGGELGRLFACQDRGDDVGSEEFQPHDPRCVRGRDIFLSSDLVEVRTADLEQCSPIFCERTSSRIRLVSAGAEIVGLSTMNFISFPVRFNRAGMLDLTRFSSPPST